MDEMDGDFYSSGQSPTTPAVVSAPPKDPNVRPHGDMLKMMNPTPNGYSSVPNHKPKAEGQEIVKHHESKNNIDHHKHSSDHVKKKDDDSKHKSSSHSKPKESSKESKKEGHESHKDKEKHKEGSSHKESSKTKDGSHKHSDPSKHSSEKKEEKHKSDSTKKEHHSSEGKPKTDNFKENEKIKDSSSKEHKEKHKEHKEKHKDKHKDKEHKEKHKEHKEKHRDKERKEERHKDKEHKEKHKDKSSSSGEKPKEKSDKPKDKSDKPKVENAEKHKEKHKDKHGEKHKDKHSEKHKDHKEHKEKKDKVKEEPVKSHSPVKEPSPVKVTIKEEPVIHNFKDEPMSEDDMPLSSRKASLDASKSIKREADDSDDEPLSIRMEKKIKSDKAKKKKPTSDDEEYEVKEEKPKKKRKVDSDDEEYATKKVKKVKKEKPVKTVKKEIKQEPTINASPKKKKKEEEEQEVWKWWEEEKLEDGIKWKTLEHCGPVFAPPYERVPKSVKFFYDGKHMELSEVTEEVAGFYGRMLDHEYTSKDVFNKNFFKDWRKVMTTGEREIITDLKKCNFNQFNDYYKMKSEERKAMTKEEKAVIKKENEEVTKKYGFCIIDGHRQKIGNFKIEPPGLFRGRGEHPKMGMLKRRIEAEDIIINCGKNSKIPEPPPGHKWKEVRHDNTVSWLVSWNENILGSTKYIMLNPSSKLKGEKDWMKYETARKLKQHAHRIREEYTRDFKSKEMRVRQRAVALYFIDKLALRAGNEKDEDTADTVGCCSLRVEHITLDDEKDGQEYVVSFDFLGKDSIRYFNSVAVEKRAYKNLKLFMENKQPGDDLFDRLNTAVLNKYLNDLMEGLTAKVFRTYNASKTLQEQLDLLTKEEMSLPEKILAYNRANRAVAILCNHQRAVPKGFSKSMEGLKQKIEDKEQQIKDFKKELKQAKQAAKDGGPKEKQIYDRKKKRLAQLEEQLKKLEVQAMDKEENKQIALGTSKLNYLDPRISVAWCKKWSVPIEKVYNKTQRDKFLWAIEMAGPEYKF